MLKTLKLSRWVGCALIGVILLTGCGSDATATPTVTAMPPTATQPPQAPSATDTPAPPPATATVPPAPTVAKLDCVNKAANVRDVSVPDNTVFKPGTAFTKTWRIKNAGTCAWTEGYQIVFVAGDRMEGKQAVNIPAAKAGADVDITINLIAPFAIGKYKGYWQLRDSTGKNFGTGEDNNIAWWVAITVKK